MFSVEWDKSFDNINLCEDINKITTEDILQKCGSWFKGIGFYTKSNSEVCLIATKGKPPKKDKHHSISQIIETVREQHSKKPDIVRTKIVEFSGDLPRIELFARQYAEGWDCWGNEV